MRITDIELLEAMIGAAREAGRVVQEIYEGGFTVRAKQDASPVTDADHASETLILKRLTEHAPGVPIVAEERVAAGGAPEVGEEFFLVDPLDGTKEFVARRGEFTVNIALVRGSTPVLGVVFAPASRSLYAADVLSQRAFRMAQDPLASEPSERQPIRVRPVPDAGLTAVASRSHSTPETDRYLGRYAIAERVSIGSSLKFCLIAEGRADLYPRLGPTMEWDTAAGHAVLAAAGGRVVNAEGAPLRYGKPQFRNGWFVASGGLVPIPVAS